MTAIGQQLYHLFTSNLDKTVAVHVNADGSSLTVTGKDLACDAQGVRLRLEQLNLPKSALVGIVHKSGPMLHAAWLGTIWAGLVPTMVAPPSPRMEPRKYADGFRSIISHLEIDALVIDEGTRESLATLMPDIPYLSTGDISPQEPTLPIDFEPDATIVVQHTSGTTGAQKAIGFSSRQIIAHAAAMKTTLDINDKDVIASWLPLYHDMGFIACLVTPLLLGIKIVEISPFVWVANPGLLFDVIEQHRATFCWLPNFAFNVLSAERLLENKQGRWNLGHMRAFINCSEPVQANTVQQFTERLSRHGVRRDQLIASYAMAENLFLVTQNEIGKPVEMRFDKSSLETGKKASPDLDGVLLISNGSVVDTTKLAVHDKNGPLAEGHVGEICIFGTHTFNGYRKRPDINEQVIDADGWYKTGDLGFVFEEQVYVTGRSKDLIIIRGRNYHPQDIEHLVGQITGVSPGRSVAFSVLDEKAGTEKLVVMLELLPECTQTQSEVSLGVRRLVAQSLDTTIGDLQIVPSRSLVKSTAGKIARAENRLRYIEMTKGR
ncbi:MAG: AMP-binding protein [Rhizobiaceae bacterium]|nr:AMP-binding protein [Rhizobiaceae bacterium]